MQGVPQEVLQRLRAHKQEHVLAWWDRLNDEEQRLLLSQLKAIDLPRLRELYRLRNQAMTMPPISHIKPVVMSRLDPDDKTTRQKGEEALRNGEVAVIMVAGGQGSRLGFDHPKGMFPIGPVSRRTLFQIHAEKVLALRRRYGRPIPFLVMTSPATDSETEAFFKEQRYFGLPAAEVAFFEQGTMPALDIETGKLLMEAPGRLFLSPNGHGGTLTALRESGLLERLLARGGTLVELLAAIAIEQIANKADLAFLDRAKLTFNQVLECLEDLCRLPPMPPLADKINLCERFSFLEIIMSMARHGTSVLESLSGSKGRPLNSDQLKDRLFTRSVNWDPALRNANLWYDRLVSTLRITNRTARKEEMAAITIELKTLRQQVAGFGFFDKACLGPTSRGEWIGDILIAMMLPAIHKVQDALDRCEQGQRNLHVAFALAAYFHDQGRYPAKLDDLAPKYISKVSDDLFSGEPLNYRLEGNGYLFYSVGPNGEDEDGRGREDDPPGDDLSVRMPVPQPKK